MVNRALAGDTPAFESLVRKYRRPAVACAVSILGDEGDADDVAQDAMIQAYEQLAALKAPENFGGWLMVAVRRRALNVLRSPHRHRRAALDEAADAPARGTPHDEYVAGTRRDALWRVLSELPERLRDVLVLSDLDGLPHAKVAAILGISVFMSRRYLVQARRRARELLRDANLEG
ncbi:MAG: sigma-70 family RNA polymerase sigma factor [Gemmatimonadaceae bacterium]